VFRDQLLDDQRDRAALQAGNARQVRARNRLARADQVEEKPPVDIAGHLTRCALNPFFPGNRHTADF
jgi:hypothetical protein